MKKNEMFKGHRMYKIIIIISDVKMPIHHPSIRLDYYRRAASQFVLVYC